MRRYETFYVPILVLFDRSNAIRADERFFDISTYDGLLAGRPSVREDLARRRCYLFGQL